MRPLFILVVLLLCDGVVKADNKVHLLDRTSEYGLIVNDCEWKVQKGKATVKYHNRDQSAIKGESSCLPMDFEFSSLFIPMRFSYAKNYLNIYAANTKTVFYVSEAVEDKDRAVVKGCFTDNISTGSFELTITKDRRNNGRAFAIMAKMRSNAICEDTQKALFEEVASMITPLVVY
jgi:hypothetical protein